MTVKNVVKKLIKEQLLKLEFNNGLPNTSVLDNKLSAEIKAKLNNSFLTEKIIEDIIWSHAFETLLNENKSKEEKKGKKTLVDFPSIDTDQLSTIIFDELVSIPINYEFLFPLPRSAKEIENTKFAYNTELLTLDDNEMSKYSTNDEKGYRKSIFKLISGEGSVLSKGMVVLRIKGKGYVNRYATIKINTEDPAFIFKVIFGLYVATGTLRRSEEAPFLFTKADYKYLIYKVGVSDEVATGNLSTEDSDYVYRMEFDISKFDKDEREKLLRLEPKFKIVNNLLELLFTKIKVKGKNIISQHQQSIKNGAFWFYESLKTTEDHSRAVYVTTAFDALVGSRMIAENGKGRDRDKEYKADMIAQAIGSNIYEVDIIKQKIIKLYELRNKIVHGEIPIYSTNKFSDNDDEKGVIFLCVNFLQRYLNYKLYFIVRGIPRPKSGS